MSTLAITYRSVESLIPYARNSRTHSEEQVAQIAASIREFGWTNPVLVDEHRSVIAGHGRLLAARVLGIKDVPTIELVGLTDAQRRAYVIADNRLALNAGWDDAMLKNELTGLLDDGYNLDLTGFTSDDLAALLAGDADDADDDDDDPEPEDESRNTLLIECSGERELETLFEEMQQRGLKCKILS